MRESHTVVSDSATPWTVARQAHLFVGILQARVLEWGATPFSISSGSSISNYDPSCYPTKKKTCGATPRKCLRSQCLTHTCPTIWAHAGGTAGLGGSQQQAGPDGKGPWYPGRQPGGVPSAQLTPALTVPPHTKPTAEPGGAHGRRSPRNHRLGVAVLTPNPCDPGVTLGQQHRHHCHLQARLRSSCQRFWAVAQTCAV